MLGSQTEDSKGVGEKNRKWRGVNENGILRAWGVKHFGISEARGVKVSMPPMVGYGYIFWNRPFQK